MGVTSGRGRTEARPPAVDGVAVAAGTAVYPYRRRADADRRHVALAVGRGQASPRHPRPLFPAALHRRDSGSELYEYGHPRDMAVAAEADTSDTVPVLRDGAFQEAAP
ncbi:hypothetical protein ACF06X_08015 [Streptomyces sp. NPDC015346]|uniref:hypothetical protein n=1 Tax=Streptomyces sp. NPDC015346 TaxID=3364954 RepID=UPI0036FAAEF5